jgi:hypothetical protein
VAVTDRVNTTSSKSAALAETEGLGVTDGESDTDAVEPALREAELDSEIVGVTDGETDSVGVTLTLLVSDLVEDTVTDGLRDSDGVAVTEIEGVMELVSLMVAVFVLVAENERLGVREGVTVLTDIVLVLLELRDTLAVTETVGVVVGVPLHDRLDENDLMLLLVAEGDRELDTVTVPVDVGELPTDSEGDLDDERVAVSVRELEGEEVGCSTTSSFASKYAVVDEALA